MRWMLVLLLVPSAVGQAVFEDPAGDHEMALWAEDVEPVWLGASDLGWFPYVDVEQVGIVQETETHLVFRLQVASRDPGGEPADDVHVQVALPFVFHGDEMQANFEFWPDWGGAELRIGHVEEYRWGGTTQRFLSNSHDVEAEWTDNVLEARFPKEWLLDRSLVPARAGDVLEEISASSATRDWGCNPGRGCWVARDLIEGTHTLELTKDPPGVGHLLLRAEVPNRASNGAATTYLYNMSLRNIGDIDDRVTIQVGGQPGDWVVHAPSTLVIPRGETVNFPVAVSVPFKHTHGEKETMQVRVASTSRAGIEAVGEVGVIWHPVPQPGGHHPELYLHSDGSDHWMNTLKDDPDADPEGVIRGDNGGWGGGQAETEFLLPLMPGLGMGLDFIPNQSVEVDLPVQAPRDMNATIEMMLWINGDGGQDLARHSLQTDLVEGSNRVTAQLPLASGVDRIPFDPDNQLWFRVVVRYDEPAEVVPEQTGRPELRADGARLHLPLQDYHDIIDEDLLAGLGRLSVRPAGDPEKLVNPGRTAAIPFDASNADDRKATIDWRIEGTHADWAAVVPAASVVPGGGNASVLVTVSPPAGAKDGDVAQLLLIGQSRSDPDVQVFARLVATVTETADIPDESVQAQDLAQDARKSEAKQSPAVGAVLAVVALAVALRRR